MTAPHPSPQDFLTAQMTEELEKVFDGVEEFFLDDNGGVSNADGNDIDAAIGNQSNPKAKSCKNASASIAQNSIFSHQLESSDHSILVEAQTMSKCRNYPAHQPSLVDTYPSWNAVQIEIQENAKLPTFNLSVDRANSLSGLQIPAPRGRRAYGPKRRRRAAPSDSDVYAPITLGSRNEKVTDTSNNAELLVENFSLSPIPKLSKHTIDHTLTMDNETSEAIEELLRLSENDINLSEMFLCEDRSNTALAYSFYAREDIPHYFDVPNIESQPTLNGGTSEEELSLILTHTKQDGSYVTKNSSIFSRQSKQPQSKLLPYTRKTPLPIPVLDINSPAQAVILQEQNNDKKWRPCCNSSGHLTETLQQAVATAAAIATKSPSLSGVLEGGKLDNFTAAALSVQTTTIVHAGPITHPQEDYVATHRHTRMLNKASNSVKKSANLPPRNSTKLNQTPRHNVISSDVGTIQSPALYAVADDESNSLATDVLAERLVGSDHHVMGVPARPQDTDEYHLQQTLSAVNPPLINPLMEKEKKLSPENTEVRKQQLSREPTVRLTQPIYHARNKVHRQQQPITIRNHPVTGKPMVPIYTMPIPSTKPLAELSPSHKLFLEKDKILKLARTDDPAYERKKQRAKDARVRLNESIEELAVAIELSGVQSKARLKHFMESSSPTTSDLTEMDDSQILSQLMKDTKTQAEDAKKWDRPAFIALSANIIHSLNAQCDALVRDLVQLKTDSQMCKQNRSRSGSYVGNLSSKNGSIDNECHAAKESSSKVEIILRGTTTTFTSNNLNEDESHVNIVREIIESPKFLSMVAAFLDPFALCKCICVSMEWMSYNIFQNQDTWLRLCLKRFGASSVRKWEGDEDDEEETSLSHASPSMDLYCRMAENNVKPFCSLDGSLCLGGSTVDRSVAGWVSLIERSNGETSRSVLFTHVKDGETSLCYFPIPVVELRILVQNTGYPGGAIFVPEQQFSVDASTRRKGEKMLEILSDERFKTRIVHIEKKGYENDSCGKRKFAFGPEMCQLRLFEYAVISVHIHARGCSTTSKFCRRAKKIQILLSINGTTRPLVIPISWQR